MRRLRFEYHRITRAEREWLAKFRHYPRSSVRGCIFKPVTDAKGKSNIVRFAVEQVHGEIH